MLNHEGKEIRKLKDNFISLLNFLNSRFVIILMLTIVLVFFVNWNDLGILDYVVITTTTIYVLLLVIRLILAFIKKRL
ncbi:hypothetical protein COE26_28410 [Bacillus cereus]|nr:hypothetical protein CN452_29590 [Bacillus cereus]PFV86968.1 hypothetical protein COL21_29875 [Bacillus thuringiensis]PGW64575.1 hypothetical protein COE26_28410 [Bacillus cereus]PGY64521.1 hypothetical protein COE34_28045 [Bacillus cereus]QEL82702.1 hypothetical protein DN407_29950 [Bacillus sp. JAS24-2]